MDKYEARKNKLKKAKKRKKILKILFLVVILLALIFLVLLKVGLFNVKSISVKGVKSASVEEVKKRSGLKIGENYLLVSKKNRARDISSIPVVKTASIKFSLNGEADISIVERTPVAQIVNYTDYYVIDSELKIIDVKNEPMQNLLELNGISSKELKLGNFISDEEDNKLELLKKIFENKTIFAKLKSINLNEENAQFITKDNINIEFGSYRDIEYKFEMLEKIFSDIEKSNKKYTDIYMEKGEDPIAVESGSSEEDVEKSTDTNLNNDLETSTELNSD